MKKFILFSILSVLFYSAPGYTMHHGEAVGGACLINRALKESVDNCQESLKCLERNFVYFYAQEGESLEQWGIRTEAQMKASGMAVEWIEGDGKVIARSVVSLKSGNHPELFQIPEKTINPRQVLEMIKAAEHKTAAEDFLINMEVKATIDAFANNIKCLDEGVQAHCRHAQAAQAAEAPEQEEVFTAQWIAKAEAQIKASGMEVLLSEEDGKVTATGVKYGTSPLIFQLSRRVSNPKQVLAIIKEKAAQEKDLVERVAADLEARLAAGEKDERERKAAEEAAAPEGEELPMYVPAAPARKRFELISPVLNISFYSTPHLREEVLLGIGGTSDEIRKAPSAPTAQASSALAERETARAVEEIDAAVLRRAVREAAEPVPSAPPLEEGE